MATYKESGVDVEEGDNCSRIAYQAAKKTFIGRSGMIGQPVIDDGGFAGLLDMGDFYLVQNDDGVGTKIIIAEQTGDYSTLGYDLLAMVIDDAVCLGAEVISVSNTLDVDKVDPKKVEPLLEGLKKACLEHKVVIPGGEIAEMPALTKGYIWNATSVGVLQKDKLITGREIRPGDQVIGLSSPGLRSNGFSLVRHILNEKFGPNWHQEPYDQTQSWGQAVLEPSLIYSSAILELHGRFGQPKKADIKGICHITGGGLYNNTDRLMKKTGLKIDFNNLPAPTAIFQKLMEIGNVTLAEATQTWNLGIGMIIISNDFDQISEVCKKHGIQSQLIGQVIPL